MSFRLKKLDLYKHPILNSISLIFCNDETYPSNKDIYNTVIIGANGIGKSYILKAITDIFNFLHSKLLALSDSNNLPYRFKLTYTINNNEHVLTSMLKGHEQNNKFEHDIIYYLNNQQVPFSKCKLPTRIIASSMTISDKFRARSNEFYKYNGIRNEKSPSTTGTRTLVRKTANSIISCISSKTNFQEELKSLLLKLGLQDKMVINYGMRHKEVFLRKNITPNLLSDIFDNREKYFPLRNTDIWGKTYFSRIKAQPEKIRIITDFLQKVAIANSKMRKYVLEYDIINSKEIIYDAEAIDLLSKLDILTFPSIRVYKNYENYNFMDSSSGETNLLCQFIGILSDIKEDSLIIIDEPENSSHPNWQINYIKWLKDIFSHYSSCHFILATHSHFILTDLQEKNSTIIALEKNNGKLTNIAENLNTFCWSVDDILYSVFHVRNTRNSVFENKMIQLYRMITDQNTKQEEITQLTEELEKYKLSDNDPLNRLINLAKKRNA